MQIIDCPWELDNIGVKTIQLNYFPDDGYNRKDMLALSQYQYAVAKVPCGNVNCIMDLQNDGFSVIEVQISLSKDIKSFLTDSSKYKDTFQYAAFQEIHEPTELNKMLSCIDDDMFSTDRITLDSHFGKKLGRQRYANWMKSEWHSQSSQFWWVIYRDKKVGFMMIRQNNTEIECLLNGLFTPYQHHGIGILTPASPLLMSIQKRHEIQKETVNISSNNMPVVNLYNKLNFKIEGMQYVLVKHIKA